MDLRTVKWCVNYPPAEQEKMMMKMTKTMTEQNGFFPDFLGDSQTCLGATLGASVKYPGQDKVL